MAVVRPFRALRYDPAVAGPLESLVAPPYDVIGAQEREALLARSPYNVVHLTLPESEEDAAKELADWREGGVLVEEQEPAFWWLSQEYVGPDGVERRREGFVAALQAEPYANRVVLPHERTHAGPKEGRLRLLQATRTRESVRCGLGMYFVTLDAPELVEASAHVVEEFELEWFFSIQFMGEKVIEINPRISTMMIQEDFNLPWLAVKRALGEASDDELRAVQERVRPGHTVLRFFEQVEFDL